MEERKNRRKKERKRKERQKERKKTNKQEKTKRKKEKKTKEKKEKTSPNLATVYVNFSNCRKRECWITSFIKLNAGQEKLYPVDL